MALTPKQSKDRALASKYRAEAKISREKAKLAKETTKAAEYKTAQAQANAELAMKKNEEYEKRIEQRDRQLEYNKDIRVVGGVNDILSGLNTIASSSIVGNVPSRISSGEGYTSFISPQVAYIITKSKGVIVPDNFEETIGYLCLTTYTLSDLIGEGFTLCDAFHLEGIPATSKELQAIDDYLKNGVIL